MSPSFRRWCPQHLYRRIHLVRYSLSRRIEPSRPISPAVMIIGCGDYSPIKTYIETAQVAYPIYGNPSLSIYKALRFHSTLNGSKSGEEKGYMKELGSWGTRFWSGLRQGPAKNILQAASIGPKAQNGGELVVEAGPWSLSSLHDLSLIRPRRKMLFHPPYDQYCRPYGAGRFGQAHQRGRSASTCRGR